MPDRLLAILVVLLLPLCLSASAEEVTVPADVPERARDLMTLPVEVEKVHDRIWVARGVGNVFLIRTKEGAVVWETGVPWQGGRQRELLLEASPGPVTHIGVSHAHGDHMGGLRAWRSELEAGAELIAHERYPYMNRIYGDTEPYLWQHRTGTLYETPAADEVPREVEPTRLVRVDEDHAFEVGGVRFVAIAARNSAEGEDALLLWLPDERVLLTGDFFGPLYPMVPNLYTVRGEKIREPLGYIEALDRVIALRPVLMLPAHFGSVEGEDYIQASLRVTRDGVQYVYDETVAGMNSGRSLWETMRTVELPPELRISQGHGKTSWNVRAIWELLSGWYDYRTVAGLYDVPAKAVYPDLVELAGGVEPIVERARGWLDRGDPLRALRLLEVASSEGASDPAVQKLRRAAIQKLLEREMATHRNMSAVGILQGRTSQIDRALGEKGR